MLRATPMAIQKPRLEDSRAARDFNGRASGAPLGARFWGAVCEGARHGARDTSGALGIGRIVRVRISQRLMVRN